jgi:tetratricopeptide (TPR) repeat protein
MDEAPAGAPMEAPKLDAPAEPAPPARPGAPAMPEPEPLRNMARSEADSESRPAPSMVAPPRPITRLPDSDAIAYRPPPTIERPKAADAWEGRFAEVMTEIRAGRPDAAMTRAQAWRAANPGDELALLALGEAAEAKGDLALAARAYGSLIDLFPGRADIRRMAGERLEALGDAGLALAIDTFAQAVAQRPDHPASHRLYAFALLKAGRHAEAFAAALAGERRSYPWGRFAGVQQILAEDLRLIAAAWTAARPDDKERVAALAAAGVAPDASPTLRFVLNWETDANDVDFHIFDGKGGHAYYSARTLPSGGQLYADVTTGYGPECFTIPGPASAYPYVLQAHYYSRGPMGYGMGKLQAIEHDGRGTFAVKEHPFVIMKDGAYVDLGRVDGPLAALKSTRLPSGTGATGYTPPPPTGTYTPPPPTYTPPEPPPQPQPRPQPRPRPPPT